MSTTMEFYVCQDCAMFIANGDLPEGDCAAILGGVDDVLPAQWCLDSGENGEGDVEFSSSSCDCCGSSLAGSRFRANLVEA
jgi:hypothetical protein